MNESTPTTPCVPRPLDYPGRTTGVVGLALSLVLPPLGLAISLGARAESSRAGHTNSIATTGAFVGTALTAIHIAGVLTALGVGPLSAS